MRSCGAKWFRAVYAKLRMAKTFNWLTAAINDKSLCVEKWAIRLFDFEIIIVIVFRIYDLTIYQ